MGNIIRLLTSRSEEIKGDLDIFVDFENCQPSDEEYEIWLEINEKLDRSGHILLLLQNYRGASVEIRAAIERYSDQLAQMQAWKVLTPLINQLRYCYDFAVEIAEIVPRLLNCLCSDELTVWENLESQQALFKQFADILDFIMKFDDLKMEKPSIQNDFSFYRRLKSRYRVVEFSRQSAFCEDPYLRLDDDLSDEFCSRMSLFFAEATPLLKLVGRYTIQYHSLNLSIPATPTADCLAAMAHICRGLLSKPVLRGRVTKADTLMLCLRVMTGVIILYDHIDPYGVFRKTSKLDVKSCIRSIKEQNPKSVECLLSAIKYSTLHFNDDSTPRVIKHLLSSTT